MDSEEENKEEEEGTETRMSYPGDHVLEEDTLQYRVQGTFSSHRLGSENLLQSQVGFREPSPVTGRVQRTFSSHR